MVVVSVPQAVGTAAMPLAGEEAEEAEEAEEGSEEELPGHLVEAAVLPPLVRAYSSLPAVAAAAVRLLAAQVQTLLMVQRSAAGLVALSAAPERHDAVHRLLHNRCNVPECHTSFVKRQARWICSTLFDAVWEIMNSRKAFMISEATSMN